MPRLGPHDRQGAPEHLFQRSWQQIVAKVETGTRDVSFIELLAVCIALGTTPKGLLLPKEKPASDGVAPTYVRFNSGKLVQTSALFQLLSGNALTGLTAAIIPPGPQPVDGEVVNLNDVLDLAGEYASDPDAVTVSEYMDATPEQVRQLIAQHGAVLSRWVRSKRKRWTAREILDDSVWAWAQENPSPIDPMSDGPKVRQVRTAKARELALELEALQAAQHAESKDVPRR